MKVLTRLDSRASLRRAGASLLCSLAVTVMACAASDRTGAAGELDIDECSQPGLEEKLRCGTLMVLEESTDPAGRTIPLRFVVLPATDGGHESDAVIYLVGGPGLGATESAPFLTERLGELRTSRDVILVDHRGSGGSNPLHCDMSPEETLEALFSARFRERTLKKCLATLEADPRFYRTIEIADDLDAVRSALGYETLDLVGVSYGSRLALVYLRRYPEHVRTISLRGAASPAGDLLTEIGEASEDVMIRLLRRCSEDLRCSTDFPDLEHSLTQVLSRLGDEPKTIEVQGPDGGLISLRLSRELFAGVIRFFLYSSRSARTIPRLISDAAQDRWNTLSSSLSRILRSDLASNISFGSYLSIVCAEDVPFFDPSSTILEKERFFFTPPVLKDLRAACRLWPHQTADPDFKRPVDSAAPALLMSGSEDPATSVDTAREIARHLVNHRHLITPHLAHMPTWTECFAENLVSFVESGSTSAIDPDCAGDSFAD
jgi:pimeloyl-ACP methyl ester carboxylesterase